MGVSDRHHFDWLRQALERFEAEQAPFAALRREGRELAVWCLAEQRETPPLAYLRESLGTDRARLSFFDGFPTEPGVRRADMNALEDLPDSSCDVLTLFRASMFIAQPARVLGNARRLLRPGGVALIDWLHGLSDAPVLDLRGDPGYGGGSTPYLTTYADTQFLEDFPDQFRALVKHVNRPPTWANVKNPGQRVPLGERFRRMLGAGPRRQVTLATYLDALRGELARAGKHLIEPGLIEQHFKVVFRDARYFYPMVGKFNLYLLTGLRPVGK